MKGYSVVSREEALTAAILDKSKKHYSEILNVADKNPKKAIKIALKDANLMGLRVAANNRGPGKYKVFQNCANIYILRTNQKG